MKKILSDNLKKILSGLAYQDVGEFLPMNEKMKVLGHGSEIRKKHPAVPREVARGPVTKRIALISDGRGLGAPLDYAIDACARQHTKIDLLIHGAADMASISTMENRIREANLDFNRIQLGVDAVDDIINYISNHPSLIFLVAMPDDDAARVLIEEVIPERGGRIPVPLVLIEGHAPAGVCKQSAA